MSQVRFRAPSPLWDDLAGSAAFRAPAVLRFATDTFVEDFQKVLASDAPSDLRKTVARYETWRTPAAGLPTPEGGPTLKLYQPAQARFYLVSTSLVCRVPGLPEHTVDFADEETVSFVVRRFMANSDGSRREMAWVSTDDGEGWADATATALVKGEERHPMFGTFFEGDDGLPRRLFAGLIPVAKREAYVGGREVKPRKKSEPVPVPPMTVEEPRVVDFQRAVVDPWAELIAWWESEERVRMPEQNEAFQIAVSSSSLVILEFAEFLERELKPVWDRLVAGSAGTLTGAQLALFNKLNTLRLWAEGKRVSASRLFRQALVDAFAKRLDFDALKAEGPEVVPSGISPLLIMDDPGGTTPDTSPPSDPEDDFVALLAWINHATAGSTDLFDRPIAKAVADALAELPTEAKELPPVPSLPPLVPEGDDLFAVRCVYLRPRCGKRSPALVSERTDFFRLASFFDPDAPTRKLRVALPIDTSPATLRKYDRNVAFLLSDELRKQMSRVKDMKKLMDGEADAPDASLGISVICSFSIPIITICALIILMLMVSLLNIVFWWLPFFITCFPVPTLKAKS